MALRLRDQAAACERLGSPLYAELLAQAADELVEGEIVWTVLRGHEEDPADSALALRLMGAVHRLVLRGEAPELATHYPSTGGSRRDPGPAFRSVLERHPAELSTLVENRSRRTSRAVAPRCSVASSRSPGIRACPYACSRSALAPGSTCASSVIAAAEEDRLTLASYVWADQPERLSRLRAACGLAAETPARVQVATAANWIEERLLEESPGAATVAFHSIVLQYLRHWPGCKWSRPANSRTFISRSGPVAGAA